jgi:hypothetical protein
MTTEHPRQGWTVGLQELAKQLGKRQPGLQDDGLQPGQLLPVQGRRRSPRPICSMTVPFFDSQDVKLLRVLTDSDSEATALAQAHR